MNQAILGFLKPILDFYYRVRWVVTSAPLTVWSQPYLQRDLRLFIQLYIADYIIGWMFLEVMANGFPVNKGILSLNLSVELPND